MRNGQSRVKVAPWAVAVLVAASAGCRSTTWCCIERYIGRGSVAMDASSALNASSSALTHSAASDASDAESSTARKSRAAPRSPESGRGFEELQDRPFAVPPELPGANAPPLRLPPLDPSHSVQQRQSLLSALFPELPALGIYDAAEGFALDPIASSPPLSLADLQQMALDNSPVIRMAAAKVEEARGLALQAGLGPNPTVGLQSDTVGTAGTGGYNGLFASQEFVTAGKLGYARSAALMRTQAAQQALRTARIELASNVRRAYFAVLVSQERLRVNFAIAKLMDEVYRAQIDLVAGGEAAPYEPLQTRVLAFQARNRVVQSKNQLSAQWLALAATLGVPDLAPNELGGAVDAEAPDLEHGVAVDIMLQQHSDLAMARAEIASLGLNLRLQEVTPVPNIELHTALQHDDTSERNDLSFNLQIGLPLPVFDRNQGNIAAARAQLINAHQRLSNTANRLQADLAAAYGQYASSKEIVGNYRSDILGDQVRVYRGVFDRFHQEGGAIDFTQVVVAQQTLAQVVADYLDALGEQWSAMVDLAELMQIDDLYGAPFAAAPEASP